MVGVGRWWVVVGILVVGFVRRRFSGGRPGSPAQTAVCERVFSRPSSPAGIRTSLYVLVGSNLARWKRVISLANQLQPQNIAHRKKLICLENQLQSRYLARQKKLICLGNQLQPLNPARQKKLICLGIQLEPRNPARWKWMIALGNQ